MSLVNCSAYGTNQTGALARGLHLHTTLAVNPDGVPLGVMRAGFDAPPLPPDPEATGPKAREEKKSFRWVEGLRGCAQGAQRLPDTRVVCTIDREVPELPSELLFSDGELRVLATFARSRELPPPARLGEAVGLVARLGGWLGRTRDPPGAQLIWHGYTQLVAMAFAFELRDQYG